MIKSISFLRNAIIIVLIASSFSFYAQTIGGGQVQGSFQTDAQYYLEDTIIGANKVDEKFGINAFLNLVYTNKNFEAGVRYETYMPPLQGFDPAWEGQGIANKYMKYHLNDFEFTVGNFYEQFGSGLILRAYREWNLGFDNSINGVRVKYNNNFLSIKALAGKQRLYWDYGDGIIRGVDAEVSLNDLFKKLEEKKTRIRLGGNFVSRFQSDLDPIYVLPENVGAYSGRIDLFRGGFNAKAEVGYKNNDPNTTNAMIYKDGHAALVQLGYSKKGIGFNIQGKRSDNMDFRSMRSATGFILPINYIPSITKQHAYSMAAMYPNATQANGEMGSQATFFYKLKRKKSDNSFNLRKYSTFFEVNYSLVKSIQKSAPNDSSSIGQAGTDGYKSDVFAIGDEKYYSDFNIKIERKLNKKWKAYILYANIFYDMVINEGHFEPDVKANVAVVDLWWKFRKYNSLHFETQALFTKQDDGDWASLMVEYKYKSFYFALIDQYNYGNDIDYKQVHYYTISSGFTHKGTRISAAYGKQRQGILCVGGVCREVPASNGFNLSISSSF